MEINTLEAFMAVVQHRSFSKAAASLYVSQSNLSTRITKLEKELGFSVFIRNRGKHDVKLTPKGEVFLQYARQITDAISDIEQLSHEEDRQFLSVGANTGINQITLQAFYEQFTAKHPNICLGLHTYHSSDIYNYIVSDRFQAGIVSNPKTMPDLITTLLYEQPMFLVARHDSPYYNGIMPEDLPGSQEIHMAYTKEYVAWHDRYWPNRQYFMRLSDAYDISSFMNSPSRWAMVTSSTAVFLMKKENYSVFSLGKEVPTIRFYLVEKNVKYRSEALETWKQELFEYIRNDINLICKV